MTRLGQQEAAGLVARPGAAVSRVLGVTTLEHLRATLGEDAAGRDAEEIGNFAWYRRQFASYPSS